MSERLYRLALTQVPHIGDVHAKILVQHLGEASAIFSAKASQLEKIEGIGEVRAKAIKSFTDFSNVEKEIRFIEKHGITPLFLTDSNYPQRLLNCYDPPTMLFYKGSADLNASRVLAIVGTRSNTEYGRQFTEKLVQDLAGENILVISGLALGIDAIAHKAAVKNNIPTVGVVGHSLDKMYPAENTALAKEMVREGGGILSEFFSGTKPDKHNFPLRNRIVAGLSDATVLVETTVRGGSMITAKLADAYNRDVFAVPGRTTDKYSAGCNHLITYNKATMLTDSAHLMDMMGWKEKKKPVKQQRELFIELSAAEQQVIRMLEEKETMHIDEINMKSGINSSAVAAAILNLELQGAITSLPGKMYRIL